MVPGSATCDSTLARQGQLLDGSQAKDRHHGLHHRPDVKLSYEQSAEQVL